MMSADFRAMVFCAALATAAAGAEIEVAEELFVSLDAADPSAGDDIWENQGTLDDFERVGFPQVVDINGAPAVLFAGGIPPEAYQCFDVAPEGLVGLDPTRSIEVWAVNDAIAAEETMVAWGKRGGPAAGSNLAFNYGSDATFGAVGHWGAPDIGWGVVPAAGEWHHLVYTYDGTTTRVYADGKETNFEVLGAGVINTWADTRITIAAQLEADGVTLNSALAGTLAIGRVRVHDGVLTPEQIANNHREERPEFPCVNCLPPSFINPPAEDEYFAGAATYTLVLSVEGFPPPDVEVVEPAGGEVSPQDVFTYAIPDPPPASFTVTLKAVNSEGEDEASWVVTRGGCVEGQICTAGDLFVFLDAAHESAGGDVWENVGTVPTDQGTMGLLDGFEKIGDPIVVTIGKAQAVEFNSGGTLDAYVCLDPTPGELVGLNPTRSIEVWAFNPTIAAEETMVSMGRRGGPAGSNLTFNYGSNATYGAVGHWGDPDLGWGIVPGAGRWHYLVYTYDGTTTRVYADGVETANEFLGAGVINTHADPRIAIAAQTETDGITLNTALRGTLSIGRVRIHDGVLKPEQIEHNYELEKDDFLSPPAFVDAPPLDYYLSGAATYTRNLAVESDSPVSLRVLEPAGATITPGGILTYAIPKPEPLAFTVTVEADNGLAAEATWIVDRVVLEPGKLSDAGALFVDLQAADPSAGDDVWENGGTIDDFERIGFPTAAILDGRPALLFNEGAELDAYRCLEDTPAGLVGLDPTRSIEVWAYNEAIATEETILSWGRRGGPAGSNLAFNYGSDATFGAVGHWGAADIGWGEVPVAGEWHHLVYTYDGTTTRVYADGVETASEMLGPGAIDTYPEPRITIAAQTEADGITLNTALRGTLALARIRIHDGVLWPAQVAHNHEVGPDEIPGGPRFIRGDTDGNGVFTIGDGIQILERLFVGREAFSSNCDKTGDTDDTGVFTIGDAVSLFNFLFVEGSKPPLPPYPGCGEDPTPDALSCEETPLACR
ncbi:MAG: hypothetical protein JXP34_12570 [Planctomycetes bacterium]|nr:hypothetical protein [Planctomycetota bacterium]